MRILQRVAPSSSRLLRLSSRSSPSCFTKLPAAVSYSFTRTHYSYESPGTYPAEQQRQHRWKHHRDFTQRAFTVGIGGPVGSGKTALVHSLCQSLSSNIAVVTNDIFTQEDAEFLMRSGVLPASRIRAVETGGCPHAAIREDVSANLSALEELTRLHYTAANDPDESSSPLLLLCESGGDNLAANFSSELADLTIYVIDVAGGDKVPRKGGPGITQSDLLVINKIDLAEAVGADLVVMDRDAKQMRGAGPTVFASVKKGIAMREIQDFVSTNHKAALAIH